MASNKGQRVIQGNCIEVMKTFPACSVNFILTDPPYIVNYRDRSGRGIANDNNADWLAPAFAGMFRVLEEDAFCVSFYGWSKVEQFAAAWRLAGFRIVGHFAFPKRYTSSHGFVRYQHESAYLLAKGRPRDPDELIGDVLDWVYSGNKIHPTQKPLGVLIPLIEAFSRRGGVVLDPFSGSGSSLVAAKLLGRKYLGIELSEEFCSAATSRLGNYVVEHQPAASGHTTR